MLEIFLGVYTWWKNVYPIIYIIFPENYSGRGLTPHTMWWLVFAYTIELMFTSYVYSTYFCRRQPQKKYIYIYIDTHTHESTPLHIAAEMYRHVFFTLLSLFISPHASSTIKNPYVHRNYSILGGFHPYNYSDGLENLNGALNHPKRILRGRHPLPQTPGSKLFHL